MRLEVLEKLKGEIAHHFEGEGGDYIFSFVNRFWGRCNGVDFQVTVPSRPWKRLLSMHRLLRRFARTDKSNAVFNAEKDGVIIIYDGRISFFDMGKHHLSQVGQLRQSRNVLHQGLAVTPHGLFFGEYGHNAERASVPVWGSYDGGRSWSVVHEFPAGAIKHIHGVYWDPFEERLWIPTGDFLGECYVFVADPRFREMRRLGDGEQHWRAVSVLFDRETVLLPMDSPLQLSLVQVFDRAAGTLRAVRTMDGPVWYTKSLTDGVFCLQSTVEIGVGVTSQFGQLYGARDFSNWRQMAAFKKDLWPMPWFKFGTISFADGDQTSQDFVIFGEGLRDLDGCILRVRIVEETAR